MNCEYFEIWICEWRISFAEKQIVQIFLIPQKSHKMKAGQNKIHDIAKTWRFGLTWNAEIIVVQDEFFDIADFVESFATNFLDTVITKINNLE